MERPTPLQQPFLSSKVYGNMSSFRNPNVANHIIRLSLTQITLCRIIIMGLRYPVLGKA
jgi:hypothetical protein